MKLSSSIIHLIQKQGFTIVSTLDPQGGIHCSAKGIVGIEKEGKVYLIDLYRRNTFDNLKRNPAISITAVDEHRFIGYALKGKAKIVEREYIEGHIIKKWEKRVIQRISKRVIKNLKENKGAFHQPEALFPHPEYLIEMDVKEIIDLTPAHLKRKVRR